MNHHALVSYTARLTFGHDAAQFRQLVTFLATVSLVLWVCVLATMIVRLLLCHVWYRGRQAIQPNDLTPP